MNARRRVALFAVAGLLVVVPAFCWPGRAGAQSYGSDGYESEKITYQKNPKIKCLPLVKVPKKVPEAPRQLILHQQHQGCTACHRSNKPVARRGDKPKVQAATAIVVNPLDEPIEYQAKGGNGEWRSFTLEPGEARRHTFNYTNARQRKKHQSPPVWVRYEAGGHQQQKKLKLVSTPRRDFGNVYYFKKTRDDVLLVSTPRRLLYR
jgi:hypothetical protein